MSLPLLCVFDKHRLISSIPYTLERACFEMFAVNRALAKSEAPAVKELIIVQGTSSLSGPQKLANLRTATEGFASLPVFVNNCL